HEAFIEIMRVQYALLMREVGSRFGKNRLGYVWALVEPMMHVAVFIGIKSVIGSLGPPGIPMALFLITGIVPFLMMRTTMTRVIAAASANRGLLAFPQIMVMDIILARAVLEFVTHAAVMAILIF